MSDLERRLQALELVMAERLALEPVPVIVHIEDNIREAMRNTAPDKRDVQEAALQFLAGARGGFDPYSAGYGIQNPGERTPTAS